MGILKGEIDTNVKTFEEIEITTAEHMLWFSLFIFYSEIGLEAPGQVIHQIIC